MRFGDPSVESAFVWLRAIGEECTCVCKCGVLLVRGWVGSLNNISP